MPWYDYAPLAVGLVGVLLIWLKRPRLGYALLLANTGYFLWANTRGAGAPWWDWAIDVAVTLFWAALLVRSFLVHPETETDAPAV